MFQMDISDNHKVFPVFEYNIGTFFGTMPGVSASKQHRRKKEPVFVEGELLRTGGHGTRNRRSYPRPTGRKRWSTSYFCSSTNNNVMKRDHKRFAL